jgi:hypothetical protein
VPAEHNESSETKTSAQSAMHREVWSMGSADIMGVLPKNLPNFFGFFQAEKRTVDAEQFTPK